jgi:hypothetical protein
MKVTISSRCIAHGVLEPVNAYRIQPPKGRRTRSEEESRAERDGACGIRTRGVSVRPTERHIAVKKSQAPMSKILFIGPPRMVREEPRRKTKSSHSDGLEYGTVRGAVLAARKHERLGDLTKRLADGCSGLEIRLERFFGLSILQAVVVRERVGCDLLARDFGDGV